MTNFHRCAHEIDIPEAVVNHWKGSGKSQLIAELELLPVVICFEAYKQLFHRRRVLVFVDNNAVRDTIAKASTRSLTLMVLLSELHRLCGSIQCLAWVSRVPSKSDIADLPSRQLPAEAAKIIGGVHDPDLRPTSSLCEVICDSTSFVSHMRNVLMKIEEHNKFGKEGVSLTFLATWLNQSHCLSCCLCGIVSSDLCEPESPFVSGRYQSIMEGKEII